jgi:hypothetical protein
MVNQLKNSSIISKRNTLKSKVVKVSLFVFKGRIKEECVQVGPLCSPVSTSVGTEKTHCKPFDLDKSNQWVCALTL